MNNIYYGIGLILLAGLIAICIPGKIKGILFCILTGIGNFFSLIPALRVLFTGETIRQTVFLSFPLENTPLVIDGLSSIFILLIAFGSLIASFYSNGYLQLYRHRQQNIRSYYFFMSIFNASMILVVIVQQVMAFLIAWEIMSLASFFLVTFENEKPEVFKAGLYYLTAMQIGVAFIITGFIILINKSGSFIFSDFSNVFSQYKELYLPLFLLFFTGFGTKAGFVPLHTWLPQAHPAAPSPISSMMSGIMIKIGLYGILRMILLSGYVTKAAGYIILIISLITAVYGIIYAIPQRDLKKMLAYSSIENIGIIGIGLGIGMLGLAYNYQLMAVLGFTGALLHIINHFLFKSLLFYAAGSVYFQTHSRDLTALGGLIQKMQTTGVFFLIGSLAICALPPFNGFISEFLIFSGSVAGLQSPALVPAVISLAALVLLAFIGVFSLLCFTNVFSAVFLGQPRIMYPESVRENSFWFHLPMIFMVFVMLLIGLFSQFIFPFLLRIVLMLMPQNRPNYQQWLNYSPFSGFFYGFSGFIILTLIMIGLRFLLLKSKQNSRYKTWDCGYQAGNSRQQYTTGSFSDLIVKILSPVLLIRTERQTEEGLFPSRQRLKTDYFDAVDALVIAPVILVIRRFLNLFSWIQSGNTQQYILYGILFLVIILLWVIGVK